MSVVRPEFGPTLPELVAPRLRALPRGARVAAVAGAVLAVVNFPPRQIGPVRSEVLTLGASDEAGEVILLAPDSAVPLGARIH